jgi:superfamily II DNA or RNA helicase
MADKKPRISKAQPSLPNVPPPQMGEIKKTAPKAEKSKPSVRGQDLFIVDNSDEQWKALRYLHDWCDIAKALDIATGYFEIGSLLALDGQWQKLDSIRILMGDEVSARTQDAFVKAVNGVKKKLDDSIEGEKEKNDFLTGVPAIVEALQSGKISCRVYRDRKFHAKAYITHARMEVIGSTALVGSSNFTKPGLTDNVELNVRIRNDVEELQEWYENYWDAAEEVTPEILKVIQKHTHEYSPFDVYMKSLFEFFQGHEMTAGEWERTESRMYPVIDHYQKEGYHALMKMANDHNGAFLCDSVGLGKTFIGLMLIERLLRDRKRVALVVPKSARVPVWEAKIQQFLPGLSGTFSNFVIYNHTDLLRGGEYTRYMNELKEKADVIIIDEAHHFRNQASNSYRKLFELVEGKQLFFLTATPINNSTLDLQHMIELFSRREANYFHSLGIHSLTGHFRGLETALAKLAGGGKVDISTAEAEQILSNDGLYRAIVVQRSRAYARRSQEQSGGAKVSFPERQRPIVAKYSLKKTYGKLLDNIEKAFNKKKPLLSLAIYNPLGYQVQLTLEETRTNQEFQFEKGRQEQVVGLIRTQLLKRFESSAWAFQSTCEGLLMKLLAWIEIHSDKTAEKKRLERWKNQHDDLLSRIKGHLNGDEEESLDDDTSIPVEILEKVERLDRSKYDVDTIMDETYLDLDELITFLNDLSDFSAESDDKIQTLIKLLKEDALLSKQKVLIFSEYKDTARYIEKQLIAAGITEVEEIDGSHDDRTGTVIAFAPYYNGSSSAELTLKGRKEIRVLVSTDVLSEGLNLQDASLMINYDLHWNPVRLMQRIGRVDRRLDPRAEEALLNDHPDLRAARGKVHFWNFLPPNELDDLLLLYKRVAHKALRISKIFGIEGSQLLTPDDDFQALKEFNLAYEGQTSPTEEMRLVYRDLLTAHPDLESKLAEMPLRLFSGKENITNGTKAVFFCYQIPGPDRNGVWSLNTGAAQWFLYEIESRKVIEDPDQINKVIKSEPETARRCMTSQETLVEVRKEVEKFINKNYLRPRQSPIGQNPVLKAWMELN